jgi:Penicillin-binding Protein dimerisation domain
MAIFFPRSSSNRLRRTSGARKQPSGGNGERSPLNSPSISSASVRRSPGLRRLDRERWRISEAASPASRDIPKPSDRLKPTTRFSDLIAADPSAGKVSRFRLMLVWGILLLGGLGLALNLLRLQVIQAPQLQERAQEQQTIALRPFVPRRPIVDRLGNVLAIDQPAYTLYAHPILFQQSNQDMAAALAPILSKPVATVLQKLNSGDSGIEVEFAISEDVADRITNLGFDGLELIEHPQRLYPQQDLFANVVGYVNADRRGQAGLEYGQQNVLKRPMQTLQINRAGDGSIIPDGVPRGFLHQDDLRLQLTLDSMEQNGELCWSWMCAMAPCWQW